MDVRINPAPLGGIVRAIASKSDAHRVIICAALADGVSEIELPTTSEDIDATVGCMRALGAEIEETDFGLRVSPGRREGAPALDCRESGSTLRFLLPVAAALYSEARFTGSGRLPERPIGPLLDAMGANGAAFSSPRLPLETRGRLQSGVYSLPGDISSQYITGLLLALPLVPGGGEIRLTTKLESASYVDITLHVLRRFGVEATRLENGWLVPGAGRYRAPGRVRVDGDWSNAAFFLVAGALGRPVTVESLDMASPQGDKRICDILRAFGANVSADGGAVTVSPAPLRARAVDMSDIPDLLPALAVLACFAVGESVFTGARRLRLKESDRLRTVSDMINSLGGDCRETPDGLIVRGKPLAGGTVDGSGDHRIVMAAAAAASACAGEVTISGAQAVRKSYPAFFDDFNKLGGASLVI